MKVVCIMCGLRQLAGAGTNWKFLLSPRPIKLRVNLAPLIIAVGASPLKKNLANGEKYIEQLWQIHVTTLINIALLIIAAGASPLKKNSSSKLFAQLGGRGIITSSGLLLFSSAQKKEEQENPVMVIVEKTEISWRESLRLMQTLSTRCIFSYSDYNKNTRATIFSPTLFCPGLKMDPGPQKVCPGQCIWEELLVFEVPATVNNRFDIQTRTMLLFAASFFGKKSSKWNRVKCLRSCLSH